MMFYVENFTDIAIWDPKETLFLGLHISFMWTLEFLTQFFIVSTIIEGFWLFYMYLSCTNYDMGRELTDLQNEWQKIVQYYDIMQ